MKVWLVAALLWAAASDAPDAPAAFRAELFEPGMISTPAAESGGAFTPDGNEFYFTLRTPTTTSIPKAAICVSRLRNGRWTKPEVASFSGSDTDYAPSISPQGERLLFTSFRQTGAPARFDTNLWIVERVNGEWGLPSPLDSPINTESNEEGGAIASDGTLYFASDRPGGKGSLDIYRARPSGRSWIDVRPVAEVNSPYAETHPFVTRDGRLLLFSSVGRPEDAIAGGAPYPRGDLYACARSGGRWGAPRRLSAAVNTPATEAFPTVSPDGQWLYFTSEVSFAIVPLPQPLTIEAAERHRTQIRNGTGNIFRIPMKAAGLP